MIQCLPLLALGKQRLAGIQLEPVSRGFPAEGGRLKLELRCLPKGCLACGRQGS